MDLQTERLRARFHRDPVHTASELRLLAGRFPANIKLFTATRHGRLLAGIVIYESRNVAHTQYIAASDEGRDLCANDALVEYLLEVEYAGKRYFDFGTANEQNGRVLNEGLFANKESFGARAIAYEFFELTA
jgi:hypothetical protein